MIYLNLLAQAGGSAPADFLFLLCGLLVTIAIFSVGVRIALGWYDRHYPRTTIYDYQRGLHYRDGILEGMLEPGTYRLSVKRSAVSTFDTREMPIQVAGQEVLTADALGFKLSLVGSYRVTDPMAASKVVSNYYTTLYSDLQAACRSVLEQMTCEEILAARNVLGQKIFELAGSQTGRYGVELVSLSVRDFMLPGQLKAIYAKVAEAKQESLAAMERARGETAALRSLANASRVMASNPGLGLLRTLQTLEKSTGNTLVMLPPELAGRLPEKLLETGGVEKQAPGNDSQPNS
ncbi:MAG: slipin family protein [Planctomycetota bacterium]